MWKKLVPIIILLVLATAIATGIWYCLKLLDPEKYRAKLEQSLESRLNADVKVGILAPIFYPGMGVEFRNIEISPLDSNGEPCGDRQSLKRLKLVIDHHVLWEQKKIFIKEIILDRPALALRRSAEGKWTIKDLVKKSGAETSEESTQQTSRSDSWLMKRLDPYIPKAGTIDELMLYLERIIINDADLTFIDDKKGKYGLLEPLRFTGLDLKLDSAAQEYAANLQLSALFPQSNDGGSSISRPLEIEGRLMLDPSFQWARIEDLRGGWGSDAVIKTGLAEVEKNNGGGVSIHSDMEIEANMGEIRKLILSLPLSRLDMLRRMDFSGKSSLELSLNWPGIEKKPQLSYAIKAVVLDGNYDPGMVIAPVYDFSGSVDVKNRYVRIPYTEVTVAERPMTASLFYHKAGHSEFTINARGEGIDLAKLFPSRPSTSSQGAAQDTYEKLKPLHSKWGGKARLTDSIYQNILIKRANGEWRFSDRVLYFPTMHIMAFDGKYEDKASWVDFNTRNRYTYFIEGEADDMKLARCFQEAFGIKFFIDGTFDWDGYIFGDLDKGIFSMDSINGRLKIKVRKGEFTGYSLGARVLGFLGLPIDQEKHAKYFDRLESKMVIVDGVTYFDDIVVRSWNLEAHAAGSIDMVKQEMNIWVAIYPLEVLSTLTKPLPLIGALINTTQEALFGYYVKINGSWYEPKISSYLPLTERIPKMPESRSRPEPPIKLEKVYQEPDSEWQDD